MKRLLMAAAAASLLSGAAAQAQDFPGWGHQQGQSGQQGSQGQGAQGQGGRGQGGQGQGQGQGGRGQGQGQGQGVQGQGGQGQGGRGQGQGWPFGGQGSFTPFVNQHGQQGQQGRGGPQGGGQPPAQVQDIFHGQAQDHGRDQGRDRGRDQGQTGGQWNGRRDDGDHRNDQDRYSNARSWNSGHGSDRGWRSEHRYRGSAYGLSFRDWGFGQFLPQSYFDGYVLYDYWRYGLPRPPPGDVWVRSGPNVLLVNRYNGYIEDVVYDVFW